jgi:hypothetical protein
MIYELSNFSDFIESFDIIVNLLLPLLKLILLHSESQFTSVSKIFNFGPLCLIMSNNCWLIEVERTHRQPMFLNEQRTLLLLLFCLIIMSKVNPQNRNFLRR